MIQKKEADSKIVAAIASVMGAVGKLAKESKNTFDNYNFTSIDDFLSATGKACSENGVVIVQNEVGRETIEKKGKQWLMMKFSFIVLHDSGESLPVVYRSVSVPFTGAQAFGSAQSYSLKQFMRSLFQITTGDKDDADFAPPQEMPPMAKPESRPITSGTAEEIMERVSMMAETFPAVGIFEDWIAKIKNGKKLKELTETEGGKLLEILGQDPKEWHVSLVDAREAVIEDASVAAAEANF